jgi:GNAT superfamily N-acetyltransferase
MKQYAKNSKIKEIKVVRSIGSESFFAEIIIDAASSIDKENYTDFLTEVSKVVERAWGKFPKKYLKESILHSKYLMLLRDDKGGLIGIAPIRKIHLDGRYVYSFGLTAVDPDYQGLGLMRKMHTTISRRVFIENFLRFRRKVEFVFITPNIRTIGSLARIADFIYPNPYSIEEKTGRIDYADDKTWETVNLYLKATGEKYRRLNRRGNVMIGFYDDKPNLVVKENESVPDKKLRIFASRYLKPGNEIVVRAEVSLGGLIKSEF